MLISVLSNRAVPDPTDSRGMIPPWFRGPDPTKHGLSTNNARLENLEESKLYKPALMQGNRCVVICDGKRNSLCITSLKSLMNVKLSWQGSQPCQWFGEKSLFVLVLNFELGLYLDWNPCLVKWYTI